ncbi:MAG: carboxypeptidase regulatory-like domain-containing protein [Pirellulales bacterium]
MNFARYINISIASWIIGSLAMSGVYAKSGVVRGTISVTGVSTPENVLVYVMKVPGDFPPATSPFLMDTKQLMFAPTVLPIVKGSTVQFTNRDRVKHNVMWLETKDGSYQTHSLGTWTQGEVREFTYEREGVVPLGCKVHPEMAAHIVVLQNPFFVVVDAEGIYQIDDIPAGSYSLKAWYPNRRRLKSQTVEIVIHDGQTTVQDFALSRR